MAVNFKIKLEKQGIRWMAGGVAEEGRDGLGRNIWWNLNMLRGKMKC
jgi:hypothetical protein